MKVVVGPEHIKQDECKSPHRCMIAEAIRQSVPDVLYVSVRTNCITVTYSLGNGSCQRGHYAVPTKAARALIAFDKGEPVEPFSFEAKLVDKSTISAEAMRKARERALRIYAWRQQRKTAGIPIPSYPKRPRIAGV